MGRVVIHELLHVGSSAAGNFSHWDMFKAGYSVAQSLGLNLGSRMPTEKDPGGRDVYNANGFEDLLFPGLSNKEGKADTMTFRILLAVLALIAFGVKVDAVGGQDSGTYSRFDIYDSTRDAIETRIILDNLAKQLNTQSTLRAYLIAYAGKEACRNEAKSRLLDAKRYLKKKHNIDSNRVTFLDGGFQTNWVVQIWIGFRQNRPPEKEPTLNKNQVKITKNCDLVKL